MKGFDTIKATALAAALAIAAAAPIALAQAPDASTSAPHAWGSWHGRGGGFFSSLNLTDAQKTQIQQIHQNHQQALSTIGQQIHAKYQELSQLNQGATFDESAAAAKLTEIAPLEAKMMNERFQMRQEMLNVLTPDQRTQFEQQKAEWQQKAAQFKGRFGARHGGGAVQPNQ
jgi:protein CpxP